MKNSAEFQDRIDRVAAYLLWVDRGEYWSTAEAGVSDRYRHLAIAAVNAYEWSTR